MIDSSANFLQEVREQYENYPYPPRDPENEKKFLTPTDLDLLERINHYCFEGKQTFNDGFRVLVAGGGTGDATIFLGEQLRGKDARIVHLDLSEASMEIAKQRAKVRGLDNIEWMHQSLLELPDIEIEKFDYINSTGVLHHLEDPVAGLKAIKSVLKEDGALAIMVYATYGRTGIYQMQDLMRLINEGEDNLQQRVDNCKNVLEFLPPTNWLKRGEYGPDSDHLKYGDVGIYDIFLHSQDKSYAIPELYEWVESCGLVLLNLLGGSEHIYDPGKVIKDQDLLKKVRGFDKKQQQAIAELMLGKICTHNFYTSIKDTKLPSVDDLDNVPFLIIYMGEGANEKVFQEVQKFKDGGAGKQAEIVLGYYGQTFKIKFEYMKHHASLLRFMDGRRSIGEIFDEVIKLSKDKPTYEDLKKEFREIFSAFFKNDLVFLRHKDTPMPKTLKEMQNA